LNALGIVAFAFRGHNLALEIQVSIHYWTEWHLHYWSSSVL
jgi:hypothetical protein